MTTHLTDTQKRTIRKALATWMGWKDIGDVFVHPTGILDEGNRTLIPNFPEDLNACHALEVKLTEDDYKAFRTMLWRIIGASCTLSYEGELETIKRAFISAPAEHRSLALFLSLNLGELGE